MPVASDDVVVNKQLGEGDEREAIFAMAYPLSMPSFGSVKAEDDIPLPRPFKYDLSRIQPLASQICRVIHEGYLHFYSRRHQKLVRRYLCINYFAFFVYENQ